jgi:hypothetical protein
MQAAQVAFLVSRASMSAEASARGTLGCRGKSEPLGAPPGVDFVAPELGIFLNFEE